MGKLFGTDGIRGVANKELSVDLAMEVAQAAGTVIKEKIGRKPRFVIGRDTRLSSSMLESAMAAGLCSVGCDVQMLALCQRRQWPIWCGNWKPTRDHAHRFP